MNTLNNGNFSYNERQVYTRLKDSNYNLSSICGILANIEAESNFDARKGINDISNGYGLLQWRGNRQKELFLRNAGTAPLQVSTQLTYMHEELNDPNKSTYKLFTEADKLEDGAGRAGRAGVDFATIYLLKDMNTAASRGARATEYWNYYINQSNLDDDIMKPNGNLSLDNTDPENGDTEEDVTSSTAQLPDEIVLNTHLPYVLDIIANNWRFSMNNPSSEGYEYGYLIDLSNKNLEGVDRKEFRFYIPEFTESAGANWSDIDIPGRSVSIKSYNSTNSRVINISLELFAGEGLYEDTSKDIVGEMHKDIHFVQSLEYPNYEGTLVEPPPTVQLILGSNINMLGIVNNVNVSHHKPVDAQNRSMYVTLSFSVTQVDANPPGLKEIRLGKYTITGDISGSTIAR